MQKPVNGFILQIEVLDSIYYDCSVEEIPQQIANSTELLKLVKNMLKRLK